MVAQHSDDAVRGAGRPLLSERMPGACTNWRRRASFSLRGSLVEEDRGGRSDVERIDDRLHRDRNAAVARGALAFAQTSALTTDHHEGRPAVGGVSIIGRSMAVGAQDADAA